MLTILILQNWSECVVLVTARIFPCVSPFYSLDSAFFWFKCQGVLTLSFEENFDGVPQPLSKKQNLYLSPVHGITMSDPSEIFSSLPPEYTGGANDSEPAPTVPGVAPHEGAHFDPPQDTASSSYLDGLWRNALENYGLQRPTDVTEIHVFRVILQSTWDKNEGTRSVTRTGPMSDPFQTLERIIDGWSDLEIEEHDQSWRLSPVNSACTWSSTNELSSPAYVLTRKGNPFHFLRPHGVLEVVWGHRQWTTAIALPKWINRYNCLGLFSQVCGPMLTPSCAIWCDNTRLSEELIECSIGSFVQVHIKAVCSDLVRIDLQASLQRSIHLLHLPGKSLHDDLVKMTVFVPQGGHVFLWGNL